MTEEKQLCAICGKPTEGTPHPGADVYHLACIMKVTEHLREGKNPKKKI